MPTDTKVSDKADRSQSDLREELEEEYSEEEILDEEAEEQEAENHGGSVPTNLC